MTNVFGIWDAWERSWLSLAACNQRPVPHALEVGNIFDVELLRRRWSWRTRRLLIGGVMVTFGRGRTHTTRIPTCAQGFSAANAHTLSTESQPQRWENTFFRDPRCAARPAAISPIMHHARSKRKRTKNTLAPRHGPPLPPGYDRQAAEPFEPPSCPYGGSILMLRNSLGTRQRPP
jgi:hypothetical protein